MTIDEKTVQTVAQAIADERCRQFGPAAGRAPRDVEIDYARAAILAYESAKQKEAEGWVLVPKEPTEAMMAAPKMREWAWRTEDDVTAEDVADCYRQMLAAAPEPPSALLSAGGEG